MTGERGFEQGVKGRKDYYTPIISRRRWPTEAEQRRRDFERRYEGLCPGCGMILAGEILLTPEMGPMHETCAMRAADPGARENIDDDWTGDNDV